MIKRNILRRSETGATVLFREVNPYKLCLPNTMNHYILCEACRLSVTFAVHNHFNQGTVMNPEIRFNPKDLAAVDAAGHHSIAVSLRWQRVGVVGQRRA